MILLSANFIEKGEKTDSYLCHDTPNLLCSIIKKYHFTENAARKNSYKLYFEVTSNTFYSRGFWSFLNEYNIIIK